MNTRHHESTRDRFSGNSGFTLVELLVVMAISGILLAGITVMYTNQTELYRQDDLRLNMNQNLRAAMFLMENDLRLAGFDRDRMDARDYGIVDIRSYLLDNTLDEDGRERIAFTIQDTDDDGVDEMFVYGLFDPDNNQRLALGRREHRDTDLHLPHEYFTSPDLIPFDLPALVAMDIDGMGFSYAFDSDKDGVVDFIDKNGDGIYQPWQDLDDDGVWGAGEGDLIIWAADMDNNNRLDALLDTDENGVLNEADDPDGEPLVNVTAVPVITGEVDRDAIRMVRVHALGKSRYAQRKTVNVPRLYVLGRTRMAFDDSFDRRLWELTITCRNLGLD